MCELTTEFWREVMRAPIVGFEATAIKEGFMPSTVYRVGLESKDPATPRSVILKCVRPPWGDDAYGATRECLVYTEIMSQIPTGQAKRYHTNLANGTEHTRIVMEDLNDDFVFYPETHAWTWGEAKAILRTLAQVHSAAESLRLEERPYLMSRLCSRWTPIQAREMFCDLANTSWLHERLKQTILCVDPVLNELPYLERVAAKEPVTLVHYDVFPPNVAFTRNAVEPEAVLIDWAGATADIAEIDLAFLFQQPYNSDRFLEWRSVLRYYWDERARLTGRAYDWRERCAVFRYARIQAIFAVLLAIHRAWERTTREDIRIAADSSEPYMRFYDATLTSMQKILQELVEEPLSND